MKIAYIVELDAYQSSGVLKKITTQISIWRQLGVNAHLLIISKPPTSDRLHASILNQKDVWIHHSYLADLISRLTGRKQNYLNKTLTVLRAKRKIREFNPDVIYYRFGIWFPGQLIRFGKKPVVVELNTIDLDEYNEYGNLAYYINKSTRNRLLNRADGFCSVTEEIGKKVTSKNKPGAVISNGVIITSFKKNYTKKNDRAQLIFVGSSDCKWHGVDKIIRLARLLPDYDFHIVGRNSIETKDVTTNVVIHKFLESDELSQLYQKMDVAIGTLALHRKNMTEASPLKVRDYVAHGLPVIVGYKDTDLHSESFILNIGNYEGNAVDHWKNISQFIKNNKNIDIKVDLKCIDMLEKEKQRLAVFERFLD